MPHNDTSKHLWLLQQLSEGEITKDELYRAYRKDHHWEKLSKSSFKRMKDEIKEKYGITIISDNKRMPTYSISEEDRKKIRNGKALKWMMTAAFIDSDLLSYTDIRQRIILEDIPSGKKFLSSILEAMKLNHLLEVKYKLYNRQEASKHTVVPLRVQLFERRWYLTCKINCVIQTIPLDCIQILDILDQTFDPNLYKGMFVPKEYTKHRYGTAVHIPFAGLKEVDIKIKVDGDYADYFRKLPIHGSQKEIEQKAEYSIFHYRVGLSIEFMQALLHHGPHVEVLEPEDVRQKMKKMVVEMAEKYNR
jgi:hypothetical protein